MNIMFYAQKTSAERTSIRDNEEEQQTSKPNKLLNDLQLRK